MRVRIEVAEPLDLLPEAGALLLVGDTNDAQSDARRLVIDVRPPTEVIGLGVGWVEVSPRYRGEDFEGLFGGETVTGAGEMRATADTPDALRFIGAVERHG